MTTKSFFTLTLIFFTFLGNLIIFSIVPDKLSQQLLFSLIGLALYFYLSRQDMTVFSNLGPFFYFLSLLLLIITLVFGQNVRGATRWLNFGSFSFQSSEIIKPFLIFSYAHFLTRWPPNRFKHLLINLFLAALPILLIFLQPDLGTALIHFFIWFAMLFLSGLPLVYLFIFGLVSSLSLYFAPHFLHPYQLQRLLTFLDPQRDPLGAGYNVIQATIAIGSGRLFGRGLGRGTQAKLHFLPERHTDFIFASLGEELGFLGVAFLFYLFFLLFVQLFSLLRHQSDQPNRLIIGGVFAYLFFQSSLNIAMNLGLTPVTGVTLPLISYGGSSLLATFIALGVVAAGFQRQTFNPHLEIK